MKVFFDRNDKRRIYVDNPSRTDEMIYIELVQILGKHDMIVEETFVGPDCDLIKCSLNNCKFSIIKHIDGTGVSILCSNSSEAEEIAKIITGA